MQPETLGKTFENRLESTGAHAASENFMQRLEPRRTLTFAERWAGVTTAAMGALRILSPSAIWDGLTDFARSFQREQEVRAMETAGNPASTQAQIEDEADKYPTRTLISALPIAGMLFFTATSPPAFFLSALIASAVTAVKMAAAFSVRAQLREFAGNRDKRAFNTSNDFINNKLLRNLPLIGVRAEQVGDGLKAAVFGGSAVIALASAPLLSVVFGLAAGWNVWKVIRAHPPAAEFYDALKESLIAHKSETEEERSAATDIAPALAPA